MLTKFIYWENFNTKFFSGRNHLFVLASQNLASTSVIQWTTKDVVGQIRQGKLQLTSYLCDPLATLKSTCSEFFHRNYALFMPLRSILFKAGTWRRQIPSDGPCIIMHGIELFLPHLICVFSVLANISRGITISKFAVSNCSTSSGQCSNLLLASWPIIFFCISWQQKIKSIFEKENKDKGRPITKLNLWLIKVVFSSSVVRYNPKKWTQRIFWELYKAADFIFTGIGIHDTFYRTPAAFKSASILTTCSGIGGGVGR